MSVWIEAARNGRFRVRWRNRVLIDPESGRTLGAKGVVTVTARDTCEELVARVRRALELDGFYLHYRTHQVGSYGTAYQEWVANKVANGASEGTRTVLWSAGKRICRDIRALEHISDDAAIPVNRLTIDLATRLKEAWRAEGLSPTRVYDLSRHFLEGWRWAASQPARYPFTPAAPFPDFVVPKPAHKRRHV